MQVKVFLQSELLNEVEVVEVHAQAGHEVLMRACMAKVGSAPGEGTTFVLGAEREGLPEAIVAECDESATIPLESGAESLNVAIAGALALYEWRRRRR